MVDGREKTARISAPSQAKEGALRQRAGANFTVSMQRVIAEKGFMRHLGDAPEIDARDAAREILPP